MTGSSQIRIMIREAIREQTLIQQIARGSTKAMKMFYDTYSGYLTAVCTRYISNEEDVKDILQDSFIKIFKVADKFKYRGEGSLKAWSSRIVVNEALKHIKEKQKMKETNLPNWNLPDQTDDVDPDFDDIPITVITDMIRSLPIGYRTVFNLYILENKSHKEIASLLSITENTSASQLHRAKGLLIRKIELYRLEKKTL